MVISGLERSYEPGHRLFQPASYLWIPLLTWLRDAMLTQKGIKDG